jgi:CRP-like cAMP-binding protein
MQEKRQNMAERPQLVFVNFKKDLYIVIEGKQDADRFFIIREGKVLVSRETEVVKEEKGNILGPGDFFAVVPVMSAHSHIETVRAFTDVNLISVHKSQFEGLIQYNTPIAMKIILQFSQRLRYMNRSLAQLTGQVGGDAEDTSLLFNLAQYYCKKKSFSHAYYVYKRYMAIYPQGEHVEQARDLLAKIALQAKPVTYIAGASDFIRTYPKDSIVFSEGEPGNELFIIQSGSVEITKFMNNDEIILAVLKKGDVFGEMSLLESKPRSASAIAYEECTVTVVKKENFAGLASSQPAIIARITKLLAERIWFSYKQLANALIRDPVGRLFDVMFMHLEKNRVPMVAETKYFFNFGFAELVKMAGIPQSESDASLRTLQENKKIRALDKKIQILDVMEVQRQSDYFKKMQQREDARLEAAKIREARVGNKE